MCEHGIRALFRFEGYVVQNTAMSSEMVQVKLRRDGGRALRCPACGRAGRGDAKGSEGRSPSSARPRDGAHRGPATAACNRPDGAPNSR